MKLVVEAPQRKRGVLAGLLTLANRELPFAS